MPRVYRAMKDDGGFPLIAASARGLGVRVPPANKPDVIPDESGMVGPGGGGMSVAPAWRQLPLYRIPRRLNSVVFEATGKNDDRCWRFGDGEFADGALANGLQLRVDSASHGVVQPSLMVSVVELQQALAATRRDWVADEE